ncbi:MAG: TspO/MBR family protein [Acetobacteraceae bacterium]|nr:tryptophan-rich sensory protein [Pseudomonadota bacterium]
MKPGTAAVVAIGSVAAAALIGSQYGPQNPATGVWYARLRKPSFTPSGKVIGAVWSVLDILLCITGYRLMRAAPSPARSVALAGWIGDIAGLAGFQPVFFGGRRLGAGTAVSSGLLASAATTAAASAYSDKGAAAAATPLVLWTAFATVLSEELWRRNAR